MTLPIALTDAQLREVQQAAQMVPYDLRAAFLERLALELREHQELGDGLVHRTALCRCPLNRLGRGTDGGGGVKF
jgi:hypothetical protein